MKFCRMPFEQIHLDPNGGCRLCAWTDATVGNLLEDDLETIWNSETARKLREAVKNGNYEFCRKTSCPYLENDSLPDLDEEELAVNTQVPKLPVEFSVACDFICNHSCPSCRSKVFVPDETYKKDLQVILDKILPVLNAKSTKKILTDGNGDCFASPYIMNMLEQLHPENPDCVVAFETNGALFDEAHWERIKHLGDYRVEVTVTPNSFEPATFRYLNGGHDTLDQVIHNLGFMRDLKREGKINWISASIVLQERNFWQFPDFARRCLEEFEVNQVIAKPLYRWFLLSQDDYWFKDVYNPSHPYHKEFLEVLKDPMLKDPRVFFWGGNNLHRDRPHPAYIYRDHMEITERLLGEPDIKQRMEQKLKSMGVTRVYIYGDMELATVLYQAVSDMAGIQFMGFLARDIQKTVRLGQKVQCLCDYEPNDEDSMLILNYSFMEKIERDFHFAGFNGKLISVKELMDVI